MSSFINESPPPSPTSQSSTSSYVKTESLISDSGSNSGMGAKGVGGYGKFAQRKVNEENMLGACRDSGSRRRNACSWSSRIFFIVSLAIFYVDYAVLYSGSATPSSTPAPPPVPSISIRDFVPKFGIVGSDIYESSFSLAYSKDKSEPAVSLPVTRGQLVIDIKSRFGPRKAQIQVNSPCEIEEIHLEVRAAELFGSDRKAVNQMLTKLTTISNLAVCHCILGAAASLKEFELIIDGDIDPKGGFELQKTGIYKGTEILKPRDSEGAGFDWHWRK